MAKLLQLRGGTTSQHSSFTGAVREVTVDTDKDILVVHDGSTAGGFPAHRDLKGSDISSADPLVIVAGSNYFIVTGTTGFNDMTVAANTHFFLEFAGALVMTHVGGALDLPSGAAITTAAGDVAEFFSTAANVVTCVNYTKASGKPIVTDFVNADINASAAIAQSKLVDIVNADIDGSAAIATSKISGAVTSITSHGLATSATTDTTNAANIGSGTLPDARFPATLPAASGVNLTALNASNLGSGTVPTARLGSGTANSTVHLRGDGTWAAAGGGKVLQVVSTAKSDSYSTTSSSWVDITGMARTITPSASSSKVLVMLNVFLGMAASGSRSYVRLMRDSTQVGVGDQVGSSRRRASGRWHLSDGYQNQIASICLLDSPSSTSSISYHVEAICNDGTLYVNQVAADPDSTAFFRLYSSITCIEIGA